MSLLEQQNLFARVYTDPEFRASFYRDPLAVGRSEGLRDDEIEEVLLAAPVEVEFFSQSLLWKRLQEVEKMIPRLKMAMGDSFQPAFLNFAASFNPTAIRKHYEDAVRFCSYIVDREPDPVSEISDAARFERARLRFFSEGSIFGLCRSRLPHEGSRSGAGRRPVILGLAIWLRVRKRVLHFRI